VFDVSLAAEEGEAPRMKSRLQLHLLDGIKRRWTSRLA